MHFSRTEVLKGGILKSELCLKLYRECEALCRTREQWQALGSSLHMNLNINEQQQYTLISSNFKIFSSLNKGFV